MAPGAGNNLVDPTALGLDRDRLDALVARARREVDDGFLPSCQLAVARGGRLGLVATFGAARDDSRYRIFSSTKALVASAVWLLIQEGRLSVEQRVGELLPEFAGNGKDGVTVEQVMLHTAGFPSQLLDAAAGGDPRARRTAIAGWPLEWEPGSRYVYHPTSAHWVLAELIERLSGVDFRDFIRARVLQPLGLHDLALGVPPEDQGDFVDLAVVGEDVTPDELEAIIGVRELPMVAITPEMLLAWDTPDARAVGNPGGGAVSTAADLALFYQALLHNEQGVWQPDALAELTSVVRCNLPDVAGIPVSRSLGLVIAGDDGLAALRGFGTSVSPRTFGHSGAGGQLAWADPESGISFAYLTNGIDRHFLREWGRSSELNTLAGQCGGTTGAI
jgi:CubicO group peptidase (beta-lactamase class C family)